MGINEEFLNWCENKWENEFKAQNLFSKLSNENIDFLKDQYKARLKADMIAMLTELQLQMEEYEPKWAENEDQIIASNKTWDDFDDIIQQKINALKAESEDRKLC